MQRVVAPVTASACRSHFASSAIDRLARNVGNSPRVEPQSSRRFLLMKRLLILTVALTIAIPVAAFGRGGGMGGMASHPLATGGAFGSSPATPGTNSLGTALS